MGCSQSRTRTWVSIRDLEGMVQTGDIFLFSSKHAGGTNARCAHSQMSLDRKSVRATSSSFPPPQDPHHALRLAQPAPQLCSCRDQYCSARVLDSPATHKVLSPSRPGAKVTKFFTASTWDHIGLVVHFPSNTGGGGHQVAFFLQPECMAALITCLLVLYMPDRSLSATWFLPECNVTMVVQFYGAWFVRDWCLVLP